MFTKAVIDFDEIETCAYSGSELFSGQRAERQVALRSTHHSEYDSSIIVPKLMNDPHAGNDAKEEENQDEYEESNGEGKNSISPVALVAGHVCVLA